MDVYKAQSVTAQTKSIAITFSLLGLYLYLEKGFTGREVQLAHMKLAENKRPWPQLELPMQRGDITVIDVLQAVPGEPRDLMIRKWCAAVWNAYAPVWRDSIAALAEEVRTGGDDGP